MHTCDRRQRSLRRLLTDHGRFILLLFFLLPCCASLTDEESSGHHHDGSGLQEAINSLVDFSLIALADVGDDAQGDGRPTHGVTVLPFTTAGQTSAMGEYLARQLETAMAEVLWVRGIDQFVLVSRRHINDLLREQSLTMSDAFSQGPAEVLGRLRGADLLITGEFAAAGDDTDLTLQILSVPDGRVLRGRVLSLPVSLPALAATLKEGRESAAANKSSTAVLPGPSLLQAVTDRGVLLLDSAGTPTTDIGVILTVGKTAAEDESHADDSQSLAGQLGETDRRPLDLCIVLDTSASMRKENRIAYARFAANQIVDSLQEADRFCLIAFSGRASVVMRMGDSTEEAKRAAHEIIDSLKPGGKTNFENALREVHHLPNHLSAEAMTHYVVLISDGKPTEGMEDAKLLGSMARKVAARGGSVHTVGVSQGIRFDVLSEIANQGAGRMHILDNPASLAAFLPYLVDSAANSQADQTLLEFRPAVNLDLDIKSATFRMDPDGVLRANLGLVRRSEAVVRLLHLKANSTLPLPVDQTILVGEAQLSYVTPDGREVVEKAEVRIGTTTDRQLFQSSARLGVLLESHLIGLREDLMAVHDLLIEDETALAVEQLNDVLLHVDLVLSDQQDPLEVLAPLHRMAGRVREYAQVLADHPQDPTVRGMLYREASGMPDDYGLIDD